MIKIVLAVILATVPAYADTKPCEVKLQECKLVISDYKVQVGLLTERNVILEKQRDALAKQVDEPSVPPYIWALTGVLVGGILTIYLKR